jgi:multidrug resistance efflux pump
VIELTLASLPILLRIAYLRWRKRAITLYNIYWAVFIWLVLALGLMVGLLFYHPESQTGVLVFRTVPVVPERGGTVTELLVEPGDRVKPGQLLFTTDDSSERADVEVAQKVLAEIETAFAIAEVKIKSGQAAVEAAEASLEEAKILLAEQEYLKALNSPAFRKNSSERALTQKAIQEAGLNQARAALREAQLQLDTALPAKRQSAIAQLAKAQVEWEKTQTRSQVSGTVHQVTLNVGSRAAIIASRPSMVIVPDRKPVIVAGFSQVARAVLHVGMAAEVACASNLNIGMRDSVLRARVSAIQDVIASGQLRPTGKLLEPRDLPRQGELVVFLKLEHSEQESLLEAGSDCIVQVYTTRVTGFLEGTFLASVFEDLGIEKALLLRIQLWGALAFGIGLGS